MDRIKTIALLTSGGDAPGMNAGIRAVVRTAINNGIKVIGVRRGYQGLLESDFVEMDKISVSDIVGRGGTILFTARSKEFATEVGTKKAYDILIKNNINALVALGGDGTFHGLQNLSKLGFNCIGVPATIDLDIPCTEYTIGFDTAINTAMEGVDRIRDTSLSHERCSVIEVMGRNAGFIACFTGISTGAEEIIIPEVTNYDDAIKQIITRVKIAFKKGKKHYIIINAEGVGRSAEMSKTIEEETGIECRCTVLGYLQRGGSPTCKDRVYSSIMGSYAVECLIDGKKNKVIAYKNGEFVDIDFENVFNCNSKQITRYLKTAEELESK